MFALFSTAALYVFLYADFIAGAQVVIYVGGILVLIIFGVMLTSKIDTPSIASSSANQFIGMLVAFSVFVLQIGVIFNTNWKVGGADNGESTVSLIGKLLLTKYLLPFEMISILLLAALIGAALLSRRS